MKKRMLSMLLAIVMVVGLMPGMSLTASAAVSHNHALTSGGNELEWTGIDELSDITVAGNYYLTGDITSGSKWTVSYDVNLCLNGYDLTFTKNYIAVNSGAVLSICDCSAAATGCIDATGDSYTIYNKGTVNLYSGTIDYTASSSNIATIYNNNSGAIFNMYGGKLDSVYHAIQNKNGTVNISGGTVTSDRDAIQADAGHVTISGTALVTATGSGWATVNLYGGTFDITGGTVTHGNGGLPVNVPASASGSLNISGGSITTSGKKDTVYLASANVDVTITGGSITNTCGSVSYSSNNSRYGWAIDVVDGKTLTISGAPVIDSIYLAKDKTITVGTGGMSNINPIPVYCRSYPAAVTGQNAVDYSAYFTPKENYAGTYGIYNDNNVVMFVQLTPVYGAVAIEGTAEVGKTLKATYTPTEGEENVTLTYQWYRNGAAIDGATGAEYTVVRADSEATLKVVATGTGLYKGSVNASVTVAKYVVPPVTVGDFTIAPTDGSSELIEGTDYTYANGKLTVSTTTPVTIGMKSGVTTTDDTIVVDSAKGEASVTFDSISINTTEYAAIDVKGSNEVTFAFTGESTLSAVDNRGIYVASNTPIVLTSTEGGKLSISGVLYGICSVGGSVAIRGALKLDITNCTSAIYCFNTVSATISGTPVINIDTAKYAIYAYGIDISGGTITIKSDEGYPITADTGTNITLSNSADLHIIEGKGGLRVNNEGKITITDSAKYKVYSDDGGNKIAVADKYPLISTGSSGEVEISKNAVLELYSANDAISGGKTSIIDNAQVDIVIDTNSAYSEYALSFSDTLTISGKAKVNIDVKGTKIVGLNGTNGTVNVSGNAVVTIDGTTYKGIYVDALNLSDKASLTINHAATSSTYYAIDSDTGIFVKDTATLTAISGDVRVLGDPCTVTPAEGKAYMVKYGASEAEATTAYYTATEKIDDKSTWRYFHAEPMDALPVEIDADSVSVDNKPYDGTPVSYSGKPSASLNGTEVSGLTYDYTWYKDSVAEANELPGAPKDAGDYVLVVAVTSAGYVGKKEFNFEITPKVLESDHLEYTGSAITKEYDGTTDCSLTSVSVKPGVLVEGDSLTITGTAVYNDADVKDAVKVIFTPHAIATGNYTLAATETLEINASITSKSITIAVDDIAAQPYTGEQIIPALTVTGDSKTLIKDTDYSVVPGANINVADGGSVTIKAVTNGNYTFADVSANFDIIKAAYTGTNTGNTTAMYGNAGSFDLTTLNLPDGYVLGTPSVAANTILNGTPVMDGNVLKFNLLNNAENLNQTAAITVPVTSADNYNGFDIVITVTVSAKLAQEEFKFAVSEKEMAYGDQFTLAATGAAEGSTVSYSSSDESVATVDENGAVTVHKVGEATITAIAAETSTYAQATASYTLNVSAKALTITAEDKSAYVGSKVPELTYTVSGLVGEEQLTKEPTLSTDADMKKPGDYTITASGAQASDNYTIIYADGKLTVSYAPVYSDPTYKPTIEDTTGGDTTVSDKNPEKGDKVTIITDPDKGYEVGEITVTDSKGNEIEVIDNGDGTYTYVQPVGKVTITVTYVCSGTHNCPSLAYSDLNTSLWYHSATDYVLINGLMNGVGNGKFDPNGTTSRAMIVTILWRLEGEPVVDYLMQFDDIPADTWYTEAVRWAASEKIVEGYSDTTFGPNDAITREQFATILWRYTKYKGYDVSVGEDTNILSYNDAFDISEWAIPAMQWACGAGLMQGDGANLTPKADATRTQAAALFQRFCENVAEK